MFPIRFWAWPKETEECDYLIPVVENLKLLFKLRAIEWVPRSPKNIRQYLLRGKSRFKCCITREEAQSVASSIGQKIEDLVPLEHAEDSAAR